MAQNDNPTQKAATNVSRFRAVEPIGGHPSFVEKAPNVRLAFNYSRDPLMAKQMDDLNKTESERREDQSGGGSSMVKKDRPAPAYRPPSHLRRETDKAMFRTRSVKEQYEWAMRHRDNVYAAKQQQSRTHTQQQGPQMG